MGRGTATWILAGGLGDLERQDVRSEIAKQTHRYRARTLAKMKKQSHIHRTDAGLYGVMWCLRLACEDCPPALIQTNLPPFASCWDKLKKQTEIMLDLKGNSPFLVPLPRRGRG
jgi:hypothetical protein